MGILDLFKKDATPRLYRAAIATAGTSNIRNTTLNGAYVYWQKDLRERKHCGKSCDPADMMDEYRANRDPEWDAMCIKVGITDTDIYNLLIEAINQYQSQDTNTPIRALKIGRNSLPLR